MKRRAFLRLLGMVAAGAAAQTVLPAHAFDELVYDPTLPRDVPVAVVDLETMTRRVALAMQSRLRHVTSIDGPGFRLGDDVRIDRCGKPLRLTDQVSSQSPIDFHVRQPVPAHDLDMMGHLLAMRAQEHEMTVFAPLGVPKGVHEGAIVTLTDGPVVRGILAYDIWTDRVLARFDALGGRA